MFLFVCGLVHKPLANSYDQNLEAIKILEGGEKCGAR